MSEAVRTSRGPAAPRLYRDPVKASTAITGIPTSRTSTDRPRISASSFKLPSSGITVDASRMESFSKVIADHAGRIAAADRASVPERVRELGQRLLDLHLEEVRSLQDRYRAELAREWHQEQSRQQQAFTKDPEIGGKKAAATLASAKSAIERYEREHGKKHGEALRDALTKTGAGNHPAIVRFAAWAGKGLGDRKMSEELYRDGLRQK
jgi:hypothetical protein